MSCSYDGNSGDLILPAAIDKNSADCESRCFESCTYNNMDEVQQDILREDCNEACISSGGEVTYTGEDASASVGHRLYAGRSYTWDVATAEAAKFVATGSTTSVIAASEFTD